MITICCHGIYQCATTDRTDEIFINSADISDSSQVKIVGEIETDWLSVSTSVGWRAAVLAGWCVRGSMVAVAGGGFDHEGSWWGDGRAADCERRRRHDV